MERVHWHGFTGDSFCSCVWLHTIGTVIGPLFMCPSSFCTLLGIWQRQTIVLQKWAAASLHKQVERGGGMRDGGGETESKSIAIKTSSFVFCLAVFSGVTLWNWSLSALDLNLWVLFASKCCSNKTASYSSGQWCEISLYVQCSCNLISDIFIKTSQSLVLDRVTYTSSSVLFVYLMYICVCILFFFSCLPLWPSLKIWLVYFPHYYISKSKLVQP